MRAALRFLQIFCGIAWVCLAVTFASLNYRALIAFIGGSIVALVPVIVAVLTVGDSDA
jgi:hypothetical protein